MTVKQIASFADGGFINRISDNPNCKSFGETYLIARYKYYAYTLRSQMLPQAIEFIEWAQTKEMYKAK